MPASWLVSLDRYFFATDDGRNLNLFRALFCGSLAVVHFTQIWRLEHLYHSYHAVYFPIPPFEQFGLGLPPVEVIRAAGALLFLSLLAATVGLYARLALTVAWPTFLLFYGTLLGFEKPFPNSISTYTYHYNNIVPFVLLILSVSPGIARWGLDGRRRRAETGPLGSRLAADVPVWPARLVKILLACAYFGAGYTKVETGGWRWADGVTLQGYLLMKYLEADAQMGFLVAQSYWACLTLSVLTLVWELTFPIILWMDNRHPLTWLYVTAGILFHLTIAATMKIAHFLPFMGLTYFVFLEWRLFRPCFPAAEIPSQAASVTAPRPWGKRLAAGFITAIIAVQVLCIGIGVEAWPLTDYGVFRARNSPEQVQVGRVRGVSPDGRDVWLQADDLGPGFHGYYDGTNFHRFYLARTGRSAFAQDAPQLLADFRDHLPAPTRDRFSMLVYVARFVVPGTNGGWSESELMLFESAPVEISRWMPDNATDASARP